MESKYSFSTGQWQNIDIDAWTQESFALAKSNVYPGVKANEALSASYIQKNGDAITRQVVLGGLRLANVIQHIFGGASAETPVEQVVANETSAFLQ